MKTNLKKDKQTNKGTDVQREKNDLLGRLSYNYMLYLCAIHYIHHYVETILIHQIKRIIENYKKYLKLKSNNLKTKH